MNRLVLWQKVKTKMKCCIRQHTPGSALFAKIKNKLHQNKKFRPVTLIIQNGQTHAHYINMYGKIHQNENG